MSRSFTFSGKRPGSGELMGQWHSGDGPLIVLPRGSVVESRYEVIEYLGSGASASVYKCVDTLLGNLEVALKVIPNTVIDNGVAHKRLQRELLANFDFDHQNIARFYDCVRGENFIGFVMEFVSGGSLADHIDSGRVFNTEEIRAILVQIARALEVIHGAGVVHRDIKLENILFTEDGNVKVTDFGLAREASVIGGQAETEQPVLTAIRSGAYERTETTVNGVAGSPLYLAPEYISAGVVTKLSDIYAVGVIGYQLLTGTEPYQYDDILDMFKAKLKEAPQSPLEIRPTACPAITAIVERAMAINPSDRYQDAWHFRAALENAQTLSGAVLMTEAYKGQIRSYATASPVIETTTLGNHYYSESLQQAVDFFGMFGFLGHLFFALTLSAMSCSIFLLWTIVTPNWFQSIATLVPPWLSQITRFLT